MPDQNEEGPLLEIIRLDGQKGERYLSGVGKDGFVVPTNNPNEALVLESNRAIQMVTQLRNSGFPNAVIAKK